MGQSATGCEMGVSILIGEAIVYKRMDEVGTAKVLSHNDQDLKNHFSDPNTLVCLEL